MFSGIKKEHMATDTGAQQNTIAKGSTVTGDIESDGDFRIEGTIEGNVKTPGKVVLGRTGIIKGTLTSANADIEGKFSGKLILTDTLSLKSTAYVEGEVEVAKLAVEPGANFNATCVMKGTVKEMGNAGQRPQQQERKEGKSA